jgi:hypothetical protein
MAAAPQLDLGFAYAEWLRARLTTVDRGQVRVLSTPFLDPFNDGINVYIEPKDGGLVLHDNGDTIDHLICLGVKIEDPERRKTLIQRAIAGCAVEICGDRLQTLANSGNLPQRVHYLITAILRLNDLWMSAVPRGWADFFALVSEFLDQHNVLYTPNVSIPGKTVEHPVDFVIPLPKRKERLVKLIGDPKPQTAKVLSFTWLELRESRPESERVVVLNDVRTPDPLEEEADEEFRRISDQTITILRGYSTDVYRWSERSQSHFERLWAA